MRFFKPTRIQTKFTTGLLAVAIVLATIFYAGMYLHMKNVLEEEVRDKAQLVFKNVDSIQHYVRDVLRPTMYERLPATFVIEAMSSSYISRTIMDSINDIHDGVMYRRVAMDARNPAYEANMYERQLITYFQDHPNQQLWQGYKVIEGERYYLKARAVRFEQDCMYCHGQPSDAPTELLALYGERGFGKKLGSIAGVDVMGISVPGSNVGRIQQTIFTYFVFFAAGALLFFSATSVLFRVFVVNNLKRLTNVFHRNVADPTGTDLLRSMEQGDEIEELIEGMEKMGEHLFAARRQLQDYADNLRLMVEERTDALSREAKARRDDVTLFVSLLRDMQRSNSRSELWELALPQICTRFKARRIVYICTFVSRNYFAWPDQDAPLDLPENFDQIVANATCLTSGSRIFVPVESSAGNPEGMLCLEWDTPAEATRHDPDVLQALGRQLGTAAENLTAMDSLLRQMNTLETIVEGITDPLVLMDANCAVLTANQAARQLTAELTNGQRVDGNVLPIFFDLVTKGCPLQEAIERGQPDLRELELSGGRSFSLSMYPAPGKNNRSDRAVIYVRETTLEKRMRAQVWQSEKMATVGKLTAGLAHEINNPLGVILCYTGLLRQTLTKAEQLGDLDIIERHTRQAQRVLQELLNFARPKTTELGSADPCAVASSVVEVFSVQAGKKGALLHLDCAPGLPLVRMGIGELEQVLSNLVLNALDAVPDNQGQIKIQVRQEDDMVCVEVADNGPGVKSGDLPHVFDPFFSTKDIGAGSGLGLAVVYGLTRDAHGKVELERSAELGGACFRIILPMASKII